MDVDADLCSLVKHDRYSYTESWTKQLGRTEEHDKIHHHHHNLWNRVYPKMLVTWQGMHTFGLRFLNGSNGIRTMPFVAAIIAVHCVVAPKYSRNTDSVVASEMSLSTRFMVEGNARHQRLSFKVRNMPIGSARWESGGNTNRSNTYERYFRVGFGECQQPSPWCYMFFQFFSSFDQKNKTDFCEWLL